MKRCKVGGCCKKGVVSVSKRQARSVGATKPALNAALSPSRQTRHIIGKQAAKMICWAWDGKRLPEVSKLRIRKAPCGVRLLLMQRSSN